MPWNNLNMTHCHKAIFDTKKEKIVLVSNETLQNLEIGQLYLD